MSLEGRGRLDAEISLSELLAPNWVRRHRGSTADFLKRYRMLAGDAASEKLAGLRQLAPSLLNFISNERTLYAAWQHLATHGGGTPGPDGNRYTDFSLKEVWQLCRGFRDDIRSGEYTPDDEEVHFIPKGGDRGFRELVLQSIFDRMIHRAVVEIVQPLLNPLFDKRSFAYRPKKGPLHALATAEKLYAGGKRGVWLSVDIRNAFPSVPIGRLLGVVNKYLPDEDLNEFLAILTKPAKRPGLRQGSPLSPLLLNLYLHHLLDRRWRQRHAEIPLLRFADDILLLCKTVKQARDAYTSLAKLLQEAGFELKESVEAAMKRVAKGESVKWMGYGIRGTRDGLGYKVTVDAWDSLREAFVAAHGKPNSPIAAMRSLAGWVADKGPCFKDTHFDSAYDRIAAMATEQGFEEILTRDELNGMWQRGYARWCKLQKKAAAGGKASKGGK